MVNFTDTAITVHWEPLECIDINSQFEITGYAVRYGFASEPGTSMAFQSSLTIVTIKILAPGFEHFIEVAAVNSNGERGEYSNRIIQTTSGQLFGPFIGSSPAYIQKPSALAHTMTFKIMSVV